MRATPEQWRAAGGFVVGDRVCWYDKREGGKHRVGTVTRIGRRPVHVLSVQWEALTDFTAAGSRIYPHILRLVADCRNHPTIEDT